MKRHALAALVLLAVGLGIVDPYACVQYSSGAALEREVPASARERLTAIASKALALVPVPERYRPDGTPATSEADTKSAWSESRNQWTSPPTARAERSFEPTSEADDAPPALEARIFVNGALGPPEGLASEGGAPRLFPLRGAAAIEVSTIATEAFDTPASGAATPEGGRVAMPVTPADARNALTILRVLIADPASERALKASVTGAAMKPAAPRTSRAADRVRSITVELYGARGDVEALARRLPIATLRRLLDPR